MIYKTKHCVLFHGLNKCNVREEHEKPWSWIKCDVFGKKALSSWMLTLLRWLNTVEFPILGDSTCVTLFSVWSEKGRICWYMMYDMDWTQSCVFSTAGLWIWMWLAKLKNDVYKCQKLVDWMESECWDRSALVQSQ